MDDARTFQDLESTLRYLNKKRFVPHMLGHAFWDYDNFHFLLARAQVRGADGLHTVDFCGTCHENLPAERVYLDRLLSGVSAGHLVLIESNTSAVSNGLLHSLQERLRAGETIPGAVPERIFWVYVNSEMNYAATQAALRGARVLSNDLLGNREALPRLVRQAGTGQAIAFLKWELQRYFEDGASLSRYTSRVLREQGVEVDVERVIAQQPLVTISRKGPFGYVPREAYMTRTLLDRLGTAPMHFIAHTMHVVEVLRRMSSATEVESFSAETRKNPDNHLLQLDAHWASYQRRTALGRLAVRASDALNRVLYHAT